MQQSQQAPPHSTSTPPPAPPSSTGGSAAEAPPKQVALAMDKLGEAERIIADIRIGADRVLEALFVAASQPHHGTKPLQLFLKEDACMRRYLQDLRSLGKELEESGVLSESVRSRKDFWGLHMPLVCPDGAMVAYAWKRQLAGQAGASAVDRTRLALKAFTDQKRRFFPHLDYGLETNESASKKRCGSVESTVDPKEESSFLKILPDVLKSVEKEVPNLKISTFERLDWLKRASTLTSSTNENSLEHNYPGSNKLRLGSLGNVAAEKIAVIEMLVPSTFRVVIALHPAGSTDPDAVAFFAPEESGSYVHARGFSVHHVFRHITDYAATALQYFLGNQVEASLYCLLHWICSYQTLFSRPCSKCSRLLAADKQSAFLLPPVLRPYWQFSLSKILSTISSKDHTSDITPAYHVGCFSEEL
ncbi:hypothetical protein HN51_060241 [Arachis hypogaea]|nr:mediator of RNA polymerase II transcription subunit 27 [Arachis ipaensis]XP_016179629.1 mediator of RNA polymerase II transcription subunit 27 [Arachis ipaensis]XP_025684123.1 mediator of RNA polymerase II transcription subunit 27 [Arachis hypogaea]XP_025684124.1 mediator of RNA polymerase II transcription subunit 27 [Arachis hypogaea]QHN83832.1 Mediator of RNA polymerase II transcription subunit [Arachis hypogaea]QHN83833.1 Mediator of RNA polymerase II transcription subunit [Arachis hypog